MSSIGDASDHRPEPGRVGAGAVIATGCAYSGWEITLGSLRAAGLEPADAACSRWHDEIFQSLGLTGPLELREPLQPVVDLSEAAESLLTDARNAPLLFADSRSIWLLDFWLTQLPQAQFLLFFTRAESALANALLSNQSPQRYLESWETANRALVHFQSSHRDRAILLDAELACRQPQGLVAACQAIGLSLKVADAVSTPAVSTSLLERLMGACLVSMARSSVKALGEELEARAQPFDYSASPFEDEAEGLFSSYQEHKVSDLGLQRDLDDTKQKLVDFEQSQRRRDVLVAEANAEKYRELQREKELAIEKYRELQREKELAIEKCGELEREKNQLARTQNELEGATHRLDSECRELEQEKKQAIEKCGELEREKDKLARTQNELEGATHRLDAECRDLEQEKKQLTIKHHAVKREKNLELLAKDFELKKSQQFEKQIKESTYWRIKAPVVSAAGAYKERKERKKLVALLKGSDLFDEIWYLDTYAEVFGKGIDPAEHYLDYGAKEGRDPSPRFDTKFYVTAYPDVANSGVNPLVHFIQNGKDEGRRAVSV